ncbi:MAG: RcnB family protein [Sphingomonas sp.]
MRKILIGLLIAGSALAPVAAQAQRGEPRNRHEQREDVVRGGDGQRQAARQERRAARSQGRQQQLQAAPAPVQLAQRGEGRRGNRGEARGNRRGNSAGQGSVGGWQGPRTPETRRDADRYDRRARENAIRYGNRDQRREAFREQRRDRRDARQERRGDRRDWNRGWRNDRRYAWQNWRHQNRNLFRLPPYYSPYNYGYRRFSAGLFLDRLFFGQRYWINDPFYYRLPAAPYGTQWIRYYNDVILVDVYTGEIIDVIHDFFW